MAGVDQDRPGLLCHSNLADAKSKGANLLVGAHASTSSTVQADTSASRNGKPVTPASAASAFAALTSGPNKSTTFSDELLEV